MMSITSFPFFVFFLINLIIYYVLPKKFRWICLEVFSFVFLMLSVKPYTIVYLFISAIATHYASITIQNTKEVNPKTARIALVLGIVIDIIVLGLLKHNGFFMLNYNRLASLLHIHKLSSNSLPLIAPLGISFYTMSAIGMIVDTYWGITTPTDNLFKTTLFICYWPQLTSGPITRHEGMKEQLLQGNGFSWINLTHGLQRMLWGLFKKLVISSRLAIIVNTIYGDVSTYNGLYIWLAAGLFMLQLYTDFSGCMDIIIGASECFGITLPENFRTPFFSQSVQEFWQRWHITLGGFMKDYVLYPVLRTKRWVKLTKWVKKYFGKKAAKQIPAYLGMLCVWLIIGFWHGGAFKYILGQGLWFWFWIVLEQISGPYVEKMMNRLHLKTETFGWRFLQAIRTFMIVSFGNIFFRLNSFREAIATMRIGLTSKFNPWILFDGSIYKLGLTEKEVILTVVSLLVLLFVSVLQESGSVRDKIDKNNITFRWLIYYALIFAIIVFGKYGPGYDAVDFIYRGF